MVYNTFRIIKTSMFSSEKKNPKIIVKKMEKEKALSTSNTILKQKNKFHSPLYLTWNKFKKYKSQEKPIKNISYTIEIKSPLNHDDYYKAPFFLNDFNLKSQLQILRAINNEKMNLNKNFMEENLPTICNLSNSNAFMKTHSTDINDYYKRVFKMKPLFRKINITKKEMKNKKKINHSISSKS